jgi:hypothetical protein
LCLTLMSRPWKSPNLSPWTPTSIRRNLMVWLRQGPNKFSRRVSAVPRPGVSQTLLLRLEFSPDTNRFNISTTRQTWGKPWKVSGFWI